MLVCYEYTVDNVTWNSPFADRNSSQASIRKTGGTKGVYTSKSCCDLELMELGGSQQGVVPLNDSMLNGVPERLHSTGVVTVGASREESRHEYEELELEGLAKATRGLSTLRREHDYEEPDIQEFVIRVATAGYEEPVTGGWKRLSMPSLDNTSPIPHLCVPRRNSSASELVFEKEESRTTTTTVKEKPGKILHYAEFSLYPPQNEPSTAIPTTALSLGSGEPHEYEEPSFATSSDIRHPPCPWTVRPIPAPIRLLRSASDYEVPLDLVVSNIHNKSKHSQSVMHRVKLKLDRLSHGMNGKPNDEETEKLIAVEADMTPDQLKSPGCDMLSENKNYLLQERNESNVSVKRKYISDVCNRTRQKLYGHAHVTAPKEVL